MDEEVMGRNMRWCTVEMDDGEDYGDFDRRWTRRWTRR